MNRARVDFGGPRSDRGGEFSSQYSEYGARIQQRRAFAGPERQRDSIHYRLLVPRLLSLVFVTTLCACASVPSQEKKPPAEPIPVQKPVAQTPEADSEALSNTLKWSTASEVENFGFDIYRSTSKDGPFEKMTQEPIPGAGTIDEPQHYVWKDTSIKADVAYFYYIESISYAGVRERFSPIIKAPAKQKP